MEPTQTPSLSPIITLPTQELTLKETPTKRNTNQKGNTSKGSKIRKEALQFEELKWDLEIEENVQNMLTHYKAQRKQKKFQQEENKNWLSLKAKLEDKLKK